VGRPCRRESLKIDCSGTSAAEDGSVQVVQLEDRRDRGVRPLEYKKASPSVKVTVYEKPSRYDLEVKDTAGKLSLTRK
jgi:hypothetical protein